MRAYEPDSVDYRNGPSSYLCICKLTRIYYYFSFFFSKNFFSRFVCARFVSFELDQKKKKKKYLFSQVQRKISLEVSVRACIFFRFERKRNLSYRVVQMPVISVICFLFFFLRKKEKERKNKRFFYSFATKSLFFLCDNAENVSNWRWDARGQRMNDLCKGEKKGLGPFKTFSAENLFENKRKQK